MQGHTIGRGLKRHWMAASLALLVGLSEVAILAQAPVDLSATTRLSMRASPSPTILLALPFAAMTGYAFARFRTGGRLARFVVVATQMLPPVALALSSFAIFRAVGLTNSIPGLILAYSALNLPFLTWILMGFFEGVPVDLEWAAMTDGTTAWGAFWRIVTT